jgi:Sec-independent protein translocase protein TatA
MGPERIAKVARWFGLTLARFQAESRSFLRQLNAELEAADEKGELRAAAEEMRALRRQMDEIQAELKAAAVGPARDVQRPARDAKAEIENSIRPPSLAAPSPDGNGGTDSIRPPALNLPNRVDIPDDPE